MNAIEEEKEIQDEIEILEIIEGCKRISGCQCSLCKDERLIDLVSIYEQ